MRWTASSLTDGLLDRRRQRRRVRRVALLVGLAIALWLVSRGVGSPAAVATVRGDDAVPSDELLALRAPELNAAAEDVALPEPAAEAATPAAVDGQLAPGQSITAALVSEGVPVDSVGPAVASLSGLFDFRRAQPGHHFEAELDPGGRVVTFRYQTSPEVVFETRWVEGRYEARQVEVELDIEEAVMAGLIDSTFFGAVTAAGETDALGRAVVAVFQWDIDFSRDTRPGDAFRVLFEKVYLDGAFLRYGRVLAAEYRGRRVRLEAYYFGEDEQAGYYTEHGEPLERMFLASPTRARRVSSRFNLNRWHPVMQRRVPHLGVDYAADTGTPVYAVADGTVSHAGFNPRAGNLVKIRHAREIETIYAHLSRYARGLRVGQDVEQGQLIGYVGSTGMSTGPHLHFGMKIRGSYVDPLGQESSRGPRLSGRALSDFSRRRTQLAAFLAEVPISDIAPIDEGSGPGGGGDGAEEALDLLQDGGAHDY